MGFGQVSVLLGASMDLSAKSFHVSLSLAWISPWPGHAAWLRGQNLGEANHPVCQRESLQLQSSKMACSWSGQRGPLKQGEISGQLHITELGRVGAAARHKVPKTWKKSQGSLGKGIWKNATYSSLFVFQFFTCPEQTARYYCTLLAPVKSYLYSKSGPFWNSCHLSSPKATWWVIPSRDLKDPCFHEKLPKQTFIYY